MRKKRPVSRRTRRLLLACAAAAAALLLVWEWRLRPIAREIAARQAEIAAQQAMNRGVSALFDSLADAEMVEMARDGEGRIVSASGNMAEINRFRLALSEQLGENLAALDRVEAAVPLGTLSGSSALSGRGPLLRCRFLPAASYSLRLEGNFSDAGINQTRWQLTLLLETRVDAFLAGERVSVTVPAEYLIADTVLVGETPDNYTHVLTDGEGLVGDLNDYRAQNFAEAAGKP